MATLIAFYNSDGCVGRCDARCYEARDPECSCICGGRNHGAGLKVAQDNTHRMARAWTEEYRRRHPGTDFHFDVTSAVAQKTLF